MVPQVNRITEQNLDVSYGIFKEALYDVIQQPGQAPVPRAAWHRLNAAFADLQHTIADAYREALGVSNGK